LRWSGNRAVSYSPGLRERRIGGDVRVGVVVVREVEVGGGCGLRFMRSRNFFGGGLRMGALGGIGVGLVVGRMGGR
jgi:hypothetical protein